jgi:CheY-like chemotaxis protein
LKDLKPLENNKIKVIINVDDTGDGIPKEVEEKLFDPFQSTDKTQGTGLRLYISQEISRMMDGEITVKSEQGIGSSFQVVLVLEKSTQKEIGKTLKNSNIMMFAQSSMFTEQLAKSFIDLNVNFQNHDVIKGDISSSLVQMVASGRFYNIAVFDIDVFKNNTNNIAGTLKTINPHIKLIALIGDDNDKNLSEFDLIINKPVSYQRFIKHTEEVYAEEMFDKQEVEDYSGLDILIVEDVELNREYEKEMLDNFFSITCDTAENGAIAVEKAKNKSYDAILMDMRMPVMNGLEATKKIREFDKITPIICMSANVYKEDKLAADASGMNDFIEKPLERSDIESKLLKVLRHEFQENHKDKIQREGLEVKSTLLDSGREMKDLALKHLKYNFNDDIANKLFIKATVSLKKYVAQVEHSMNEKDQNGLIEDFHALKGVLSNIGVKELANLAGELQTISEKGDFLALVESKETLVSSISKLLNEEVGV